MVITLMDRERFDLVILDGGLPGGGMGIAKQLKDEIAGCPPILVLTGRADDAWLANWSRADAAVPHPIDRSDSATRWSACCGRRAGNPPLGCASGHKTRASGVGSHEPLHPDSDFGAIAAVFAVVSVGVALVVGPAALTRPSSPHTSAGSSR